MDSSLTECFQFLSVLFYPIFCDLDFFLFFSLSFLSCEGEYSQEKGYDYDHWLNLFVITGTNMAQYQYLTRKVIKPPRCLVEETGYDNSKGYI